MSQDLQRVNSSRAKPEPPRSTKAAQARDPAERFAYGSARWQNRYRFGFGALSFAHNFKCIPLSEQANTEFKSLPNHGDSRSWSFKGNKIICGSRSGCGCWTCLRLSLRLRAPGRPKSETRFQMLPFASQGLQARSNKLKIIVAVGGVAGLRRSDLCAAANSKLHSRNHAWSLNVFTS